MQLEKNINIENNSLQFKDLCDNFSLEDLRKLYIMKEQNELLKNYKFPQTPSSDGYYHIYVADTSKKSGRKQLKDKTLDGLKTKVLAHEQGITGQARKTFKTVFELTQERKLTNVKDIEKRVSIENTVTRIKSDYKRFFSGTAFEKKFIDDISLKDIEEIIEYNLTRYDLYKKSLDNMRCIFSSVFKLAYHEYWITENPYTRVDFKAYNNMLVKSTSVKARIHSDTELNSILTELHKKQLKTPKYSSVWALELQILLGARRGELPPLRWSDVTDTYIDITREQLTHGNDFVIVSHTKTHKDRIFPITTDIQDFLGRLKTMQDKYYPNSEYLFPSNSKNGVITNRAVYYVYQGICEKLGIEISKDIIRGPHSFRRNAITSVVNATNGNITLASSLFGNSPKVAKKNYYTGINISKATEILNSRNLVTNGNQK